MKNTKKQKLVLFKVDKDMSLEKIMENLKKYLTNQGLEIKKNNNKKIYKMDIGYILFVCISFIYSLQIFYDRCKKN